MSRGKDNFRTVDMFMSEKDPTRVQYHDSVGNCADYILRHRITNNFNMTGWSKRAVRHDLRSLSYEKETYVGGVLVTRIDPSPSYN